MAGKMQKKATPRKRVNINDQILALLIGLDRKFTQKITGLDKNFKGSDKKVAGLDKKINRFESETARRFDDLELKNHGF